MKFDLTFVLYLLSGLIFLIGLGVAVAFWPEKVVFGYEWAPIAYLPSAGALAFGILQGAVLAALGKGISSLGEIARNTAD